MGNTDGTGAAARFQAPWGMASDGAGNLFVADSQNHTIRKVVVATGEGSTFAGSPGQAGSSDGMGTAARFSNPKGIASDGAGNLFVVDTGDSSHFGNNTIRKVVIGTRVVTTVVGSPDRMGVVLGPLPAGLGNPWGLALGPGGELLIADIAENAILAAQF
jgi:hypothetical protein